ncbi:5-methylcytosine restriction system specificity protein McrC [Ureibacillus sp. MALMAid1270]|uniref:5-methylcytosine restriction system specificity protein McrC n=1 Tax=Ureibacillus sp. MALMAid1270 TaxID=3411629 RepID=UPI003BA7A707
MLSSNRLVKKETSIRCFKCVERLGLVEDIKLTKHMFIRNTYHRNNLYYKRMMHIALMLYELSLLSHKSGNWSLFTAELDDGAMNQLFEKFLFHFYRAEQQDYRVSVEQMQWKLEGNPSLLPTMRTDISLTHKHEKQKIIMDAKFYKNVFQEYYGKASFHSHNMYQLFTYLMHQENDVQVRGILIYPFNGTEVNETYRWSERVSVEIYTLNLEESWHRIYEKLKFICSGISNL